MRSLQIRVQLSWRHWEETDKQTHCWHFKLKPCLPKLNFFHFPTNDTWRDRIISKSWRWHCCCDQAPGLTWRLWCDAGTASRRWHACRALRWSPPWPKNSLSSCSTSSSLSHATSNPRYLRVRVFALGKLVPTAHWNHRVRDLLRNEEHLVVPHDLDCLVLRLNHNFVKLKGSTPTLRVQSRHISAGSPTPVFSETVESLSESTLAIPRLRENRWKRLWTVSKHRVIRVQPWIEWQKCREQREYRKHYNVLNEQANSSERRKHSKSKTSYDLTLICLKFLPPYFHPSRHTVRANPAPKPDRPWTIESNWYVYLNPNRGSVPFLRMISQASLAGPPIPIQRIRNWSSEKKMPRKRRKRKQRKVTQR